MAWRECTINTLFDPITYTCISNCTPTGLYDYAPYALCVGCYYKCQTCNEDYFSNKCTACDSSMNRVMVTGSYCECVNGFIEIGITQCQPCTNYMVGCANCTSRYTCNACQPWFTLNSTANPNTCTCSNSSLFLT